MVAVENREGREEKEGRSVATRDGFSVADSFLLCGL